MQEVNDFRKMVAEPEIARVVVKQRNEGWDSLTEVEKRQFRSSRLIIWGVYDSAYFANKRGVLSASEWSRFDAQLCGNFENSQDQWATGHRAPIRALHTVEFVEYVENLCQ